MTNSENQSGLSNSFTDLMTSLAVIFILLLCASWNNALSAGQGVIVDIKAVLERELKDFFKEGIEVKSDPKDPLALIIIVPENLLVFALNDARIPDKGKEFLRDFVPRLAEITLSETFREKIHSIIVEGHTDITGKDERNLPLSQERSMSVVMESLQVLQGDARQQFITLLSASGRGSVEPYVDPISHPESQYKNRRVVFKIRVRSVEQKDIQQVI